jgi:hypothetical protein
MIHLSNTPEETKPMTAMSLSLNTLETLAARAGALIVKLETRENLLKGAITPSEEWAPTDAVVEAVSAELSTLNRELLYRYGLKGRLESLISARQWAGRQKERLVRASEVQTAAAALGGAMAEAVGNVVAVEREHLDRLVEDIRVQANVLDDYASAGDLEV